MTARSDLLFFNGIDASSGDYLLDPMRQDKLVDVALGRLDVEREHQRELEIRAKSKDESHFGVKHGVDVSKIEEAGWGVIFLAGKDEESANRQAAIREALAPLLDLRKKQATRLGERYQEYIGARGYRAGESKQKFLARLGAAPGPADPDVVPYYLLIVGSPAEIPFHVQYQIDVQYAVGRIHFETLAEYANYARAVVEAETRGLGLPREVAFVAVANPDDPATALSHRHLVGPLADAADSWETREPWTLSRYFQDEASKARTTELFGGAKTPALLFTASHGMSFAKDAPQQRRHQGALLLQDWPGPRQWGRRPIAQDFYLCGDDVASDAGRLPAITFNFACYSGGTPQFDEYARQAFKERKAIAEAPFVSGLHRRLLGHPRGGALAVIGHIERAWSCSFVCGTGQRGAQEAHLTVFKSTMEALMRGQRVGAALEFFNERYAEMASDLSLLIDRAEYEDVDSADVVNAWTSSNDARGYALSGDPAVRLDFAPGAIQARASNCTAQSNGETRV